MRLGSERDGRVTEDEREIDFVALSLIVVNLQSSTGIYTKNKNPIKENNNSKRSK